MRFDYNTEGVPAAYEPLSYWHRTSRYRALADELPSSIDVVVVGGGLFGAATAYWLARAGCQVVLVERDGLAAGATGRNGGFVVTGTAGSYAGAIEHLGHETAQAVVNITYENRTLLRQVLAEEGIDCDYREPGSLGLALSEAQLEEQRRSVEALQGDGFAARLLRREDAQEFVATPLGSEIVGGTYVPEQGLVHSARIVQGLAEAARRHGSRLCTAQVLRLSEADGSVLVQTTKGSIHAGAVVVAVNAWSSTLIPELEGLIVPVRGQVLAYAPMEPVFKMGMAAGVTPTGEYWQQTLDGTIVLGGARAVASGGDVGVLDNRPTEEVQGAIEEVLPRLFPELGGLRVVQRWAGPMAFTADHMPIVDRVPGLARGWFVGGFSGHGMPFGLRFGQLLAEFVIEGQTADLLRPFSRERKTLQV